MNAALANNVRLIRKHKNWTQQHLADTAGIQLRTLQRVENAEGASAETLAALAAGLDLPVDVLRTDFDAIQQQLQEQRSELEKTHDIVPVTRVTTSADLNAVAGVDASLIECTSRNDAVQDACATFKASLTDMIDVWDAVDPVAHREWITSAFLEVEALNKLGCVVSVGKRKGVLRAGKGSINFTTLYVVVWPEGDAREFIAVEKGSPL